MSKRPTTGTGKISRLRLPVGLLRDLPIWSKLGLIMIVPTIATVIVGTAGLVGNIQKANDADRARTLSGLSAQAAVLVHELQNERAAAVLLLGTPDTQSQTGFDRQTPITDDAARGYRLRRTALADLPTSFRTQLNAIDESLSDLPRLRDQIKARNDLALTFVAFNYRTLIAQLLSIRDAAAQLTGVVDLGTDMRAAAAISETKEALSEERVVVLRALIQGTMPPLLKREFISDLTGQEQALQAFNVVAQPEQQALLARTVAGSDLREAVKFENAVSSLPGDKVPSDIGFTATDWERAMVGRANLLRKVEADLDDHVVVDSTAERDRLQRQVLVETGLLLGMLLLAIMFAWLVARSMARSLRELRHGALTVAQYGLPQAVARLRDPALATQMAPHQVAAQIAEPLPVRSRDEFGQVAEAFNAVHLEAVRTAAEQAALRSSVAQMFVNLARRSQILVDRLIGHLDRLERGEEDPDHLAELFQLDHLATRMRRNDENLLVLAGADSTRIQRDPAPLMDVLRAAQSEVEHYTRIEFGMIDRDVEIGAHAVNDMVHLIAELLDNATAFSPPDSAVIVEARRVGDRAVLLVEDRGIGISPDQLAELNDRLANPPMVDVAVSRMMGLVVVARLAARHGVKVELRPARERGTIADITLPAGVLVPRALAGRSAGTPVTGAGTSARPITPAPRSPFGPPLALESGPSTAPAAPGREPASAGSGPSAFAAPTSGSGYGSGIAGAFGGGGLGAALGGAGLGVPTPTSGGPAGLFNGGGGGGGIGSPAVRGNQPAWSDLIGHPNSPNGTELRPPPRPPVPLSGPGPGEPLPQRRSTDSWATPPGADEQAIPRQRPHAPDEVPAVPDEAPAVPTEPVGEAPPLPEAAASAPLAPPAAAPPAPPPWPPVPEPLPEPRPMPEGLTSALDMTAEIPRVREDWSGPGSAASTSGGVNGEASRRFADETMELPIFRELESAWFRTRGSEPEPYPAVEPSGDVGVPYDRATGAPAEEAAVREPEAEPVEASAEPVAAGGNGWHTAADEGWRAASALASDQEFATTSTGLPKRVPMTQLVPGGVEKGTMAAQRRSPEAVRGLLSAYHRGVQRGRSTRSGDPKTPEHTTAGQQNSQGGKEQDS